MSKLVSESGSESGSESKPDFDKNVSSTTLKQLETIEVMKNIYLCLIKAIDKEKLLVYVIFFIIFYPIYYISTANELNNAIPMSFDPDQEKNNTLKIMIFTIIYVVFVCIAGIILYFYKINDTCEEYHLVRRKNLITIIFVFLANILAMILIIACSEKIINNKDFNPPDHPNNCTKHTLAVLSNVLFILFFILFFSVFSYNLFKNDFKKLNVEFYISLMMIFMAFFSNVLIFLSGIINLNYRLINEDFSKLCINCVDKVTCNQYSSYISSSDGTYINNLSETFNNNNTSSKNNQLTSIANTYGINYLKTVGNIPVSFLNSNINDYQDLSLCDFYYPGSAYSYLSTSPLNGTPDLAAINIVLSLYKCRIIHLDVYSDSSDPYDPNANPVVRCETMQPGAVALKLEDIFASINKWAWINNDPNNVSYPFFLYMQFKFKPENENMYIKIYNSIVKFFSKYLPDRKYGFAGRNGTFPISLGRIKDFIGKIVIITNAYPTKTILDELINDSTYSLTNTFNLVEYKPAYITFGTIGLAQDYDKTNILNSSKTNMNLFYTKPNTKNQNANQSKSSVFNPSFQDCAQYGIQATLMNVFIPDSNFKNWYDFFTNVNNTNPVLKDEMLRYVKKTEPKIIPQNPLLGLKNAQKYCVSPQMSVEKANITEGATNTSCDM